MGRKILLDGQIKFFDSLDIKLDSPALNYGLGFFETILYQNGKIYFLNEHIKRLSDACRALNTPLPSSQFAAEYLIAELIASNGMQNRMCRIKIFYAPLFSLQEWNMAVTADEYKRNSDPVDAVVYADSRENHFYNFKTSSYMQNFLIAESEPEKETLFINHSGNIIEGTKTNVLCLKSNSIYYVDEEENYLKGIMQDMIIRNINKFDLISSKAVKGGFSIDFLKESDGVFLANSLMIARSVKQIHFGKDVYHIYKSDVPERILRSFSEF